MAVVTIGSYFLPTENGTVDDATRIDRDVNKAPKPSSHGGH